MNIETVTPCHCGSATCVDSYDEADDLCTCECVCCRAQNAKVHEETDPEGHRRSVQGLGN